MTTPNVYNMELWEQSGHAQHYRENMFRFDVEGAEFGEVDRYSIYIVVDARVREGSLLTRHAEQGFLQLDA